MLAGGDAAALLLFAAVGRGSHAELDGLAGVLDTAWPFLLGASCMHASLHTVGLAVGFLVLQKCSMTSIFGSRPAYQDDQLPPTDATQLTRTHRACWRRTLQRSCLRTLADVSPAGQPSHPVVLLDVAGRLVCCSRGDRRLQQSSG